MKYDIAIIGGGVLGTCISYWLSSHFDARICVIEKEPEIAMHASSRNTGVVHSPFYLNPDAKKTLAAAALASYSMWESLARRHRIPWRNTGVLELALDERQHRRLEKYMSWGKANGIPEDSLRLLDAGQVSKMEPNIKCHSAIHCDREASTSFGDLTGIVRDMSARNGTKFLLKKNVTSIKKTGNGCQISIEGGPGVSAGLLVNCAGGNSLDIAQMMGLASEYADLHFRGEYWVADPAHAGLARSTIYTVAEFEGYPFLDPHWIKKPDGTTEVGPNAVPVPGPETYSGYLGDAATSIGKLKQVLTGNALRLFSNPEFLSLISREWLSSISKTVMISRVQKFLPGARPEFFSARGTAGIRSPVITPEGKFLPDVMELQDDCSLHIINYNSPGATGAPAYSAHIVQRLQKGGFLGRPRQKAGAMWRLDAQS